MGIGLDETKHNHYTPSGHLQLKSLTNSLGEEDIIFPFTKLMICLGRQNWHIRNTRELCKGLCNLVLALWNIQNCPDTKFWHLLSLISLKSLFLCSSPPPWVFLSNFPDTQSVLPRAFPPHLNSSTYLLNSRCHHL